MSKGTRYPIEEARDRATGVRIVALRHAVRAEIAGSIRRSRPDVGDIDLVVELPEMNLWAHAQLVGDLCALGYEPIKDGERIASFTHPTGPGLDVYFAAAETWGVTLLVRTGSAAHNIKLVEAGKQLLPARRLTVSRGVLDTAGNVVASRTEKDIFAAIGVPFVRPEEREAPEYAGWIRQDGEE